MVTHKEDEELSEINVTPFIDIMLVLLIIFMAVTPMMTSSVKVELPKSSKEADETPKNPVILFINENSEVFINDESIVLENISTILAEKTKNNKEEIIYFHIDKSVKYERMMQVMDKLREEGYSKIALSSQKAE